jgi:hypothetical protein
MKDGHATSNEARQPNLWRNWKEGLNMCERISGEVNLLKFDTSK